MNPLTPAAGARCSDPAELLPPFRAAVERLLERLRAALFHPVLHETYRTPERAAALAEGGTGIAQSMHCLRVAADVVCGKHGYDCGKHGCMFYQNLGIISESLGMTWGGRFTKRDLVHVQAVPVAAQNQARRSTTAELEQLVVKYLVPA